MLLLTATFRVEKSAKPWARRMAGHGWRALSQKSSLGNSITSKLPRKSALPGCNLSEIKGTYELTKGLNKPRNDLGKSRYRDELYKILIYKTSTGAFGHCVWKIVYHSFSS